MRITRHGIREIVLSAVVLDSLAILFILGGLFVWRGLLLFALIPAAVFVWAVSFFRDPDREIPQEEGIITSAADGRVTHIEEVDEPDFIGGRALRISMFLSIFNVHINRAPFAGKVAYVNHRDGEYLNAMNAESSHRNEANDLGLETGNPKLPKIMVRQISGAIARRIVCTANVGDELGQGERYGMIKFGSRTDVFIPVDCKLDIRVRVGEHIKAGSSILGKLK